MNSNLALIRTFKNFEWTDFCNPTQNDLSEIIEKYNLGVFEIKNSLEPGHLPKFEKESGYQFMILRAFNSNLGHGANSITEFSNKIAFFFNDKRLITIHQIRFDFIDSFNYQFEQVEDLVLFLIHKMINTYQPPLNELDKKIEELENIIFLKNDINISVDDLYYLKMQTRITKKLLIIFQEVISQLEVMEKNKSAVQNFKDRLYQLILKYDEVMENAGNLLNSYHSVYAKKTNDIILLLTVFSAFFLPLSFIIDVYGMIFEWLPELKLKIGFYYILGLMIFISLFILVWFKRRKII